MKPEQKFKQKLKKHFEKEGGAVFFIESPFSNGFPDIVLFSYNYTAQTTETETTFIETKVINSIESKINFEGWQKALYNRLYRAHLFPNIRIFVYVENQKKVYSCFFSYLARNQLYEKKMKTLLPYFVIERL